jgi:hypothetical protein
MTCSTSHFWLVSCRYPSPAWNLLYLDPPWRLRIFFIKAWKSGRRMSTSRSKTEVRRLYICKAGHSGMKPKPFLFFQTIGWRLVRSAGSIPTRTILSGAVFLMVELQPSGMMMGTALSSKMRGICLYLDPVTAAGQILNGRLSGSVIFLQGLLPFFVLLPARVRPVRLQIGPSYALIQLVAGSLIYIIA